MVGPVLLVTGFAVAGAATGGWAGGVAAGAVGLLLVAAVAAAAAVWAVRIGRLLDPADALEMAPRPPLFGRLVDAVYRRTLETPPESE